LLFKNKPRNIFLQLSFLLSDGYALVKIKTLFKKQQNNRL
jgi:hypothetical protein